MTERMYGYLPDHNDEHSRLAHQLMLELSEVRGWWNLRSHFSDEMGVTFLSGKASRQAVQELVLPISRATKLTPALINKYITTIKLTDKPTKGLILAICDPDTTTAFYKVTSGLVKPDHPEVSDHNKQSRQERQQASRRHLCGQVSSYIQSQLDEPETEQFADDTLDQTGEEIEEREES